MIWTAWSRTPDQYLPDFSDFDKDRDFDAPPAPYVHPRAFLRPEELPDLRRRLAETRSGQIFYKRYKEECGKLHAESPAGRLDTGLIEGQTGDEFDQLFQANIYETSLLMMWESLRILVDDDQAAGEKPGSDTITSVWVEQYDGGVSWSRSAKRLTIARKAPDVRMKVLLFAYRPGTPLPVIG